MGVVVAFDLDDTLCKEVDFVDSAFRAIACKLKGYGVAPEESLAAMRGAFISGKNPINAITDNFNVGLSEKQLVEIYRTHVPDISLDKPTEDMLAKMVANGYELALVTDGRSVTQRNKIESLGLGRYVSDDNIFISEETGFDKTNPSNFEALQERYGNGCCFFYVGDNPAKDFLHPNKLGWITVCLVDDGRNIHSQNARVEKEAYPQYSIKNIGELPELIEKLKYK